MRTLLVSCIAVSLWLACTSFSHAQIPNSGFEQWTGGNPDGWLTNNIPGFVTPVTQSSTSHSGTSAARCAVVDLGGSATPPTLITNFSVSQRHATLTFWYQFTPVGGDGAGAIVLMYKNQVAIGAGFGETYDAASSWEVADIDIEYVTGDVPDTCYIYFFTNPDTVNSEYHVGTTVLLDDLAFVGISSVTATGSHPATFELSQNYPNPFNPTTAISYQLSTAGFVNLSVYDVLGQEVATLVNETKHAGTHTTRFDASGLPSGVYVYRLAVDGVVQMKRMLLLK